MAGLSDTTIWAAVQDQAAVSGWAEQSLLIDAATEALCKRHRLKSDADREGISGRLSRLWIEKMTNFAGVL